MKKLCITIIALILSQPLFAGTKEDVLALGKLAMGSDSFSAKGRTAEALFMDFLKNEYGEEQELTIKEIEEMDYGDEIALGFTSLKSAKAMGSFAEGALEESLDGLEGRERKEAEFRLRALKKNWAPLIERLHSAGARFGYTGNGPGYCGVSFIEMIVIDVKEHKVYKVYLSESGSC